MECSTSAMLRRLSRREPRSFPGATAEPNRADKDARYLKIIAPVAFPMVCIARDARPFPSCTRNSPHHIPKTRYFQNFLPNSAPFPAKPAHFRAAIAQIAAKTAIYRAASQFIHNPRTVWQHLECHLFPAYPPRHKPSPRFSRTFSPIPPHFPQNTRKSPFPSTHSVPCPFLSDIFHPTTKENQKFFSLFLPKPFSFPAKYATIKKYLSNEKERKLQ